MSSNSEILKSVVSLLSGYGATYEFPGCVSVQYGSVTLNFGDANDDWDYDLHSESGESYDPIRELPALPLTETREDKLANHIRKAIALIHSFDESRFVLGPSDEIMYRVNHDGILEKSVRDNSGSWSFGDLQWSPVERWDYDQEALDKLNKSLGSAFVVVGGKPEPIDLLYRIQRKALHPDQAWENVKGENLVYPSHNPDLSQPLCDELLAELGVSWRVTSYQNEPCASVGITVSSPLGSVDDVNVTISVPNAETVVHEDSDFTNFYVRDDRDWCEAFEVVSEAIAAARSRVEEIKKEFASRKADAIRFGEAVWIAVDGRDGVRCFKSDCGAYYEFEDCEGDRLEFRISSDASEETIQQSLTAYFLGKEQGLKLGKELGKDEMRTEFKKQFRSLRIID